MIRHYFNHGWHSHKNASAYRVDSNANHNFIVFVTPIPPSSFLLVNHFSLYLFWGMVRGVILQGWWLSRYLQSKSAEETRGILEEVMGLLESGVIRLPVGEKFDLADYEKALKKQQEVGREGKVMLVG